MLTFKGKLYPNNNEKAIFLKKNSLILFNREVAQSYLHVAIFGYCKVKDQMEEKEDGERPVKR